MNLWLVEFLGSRELNQLFWLVTASSSPFWLLMLFAPTSGATKWLCRLWLAPPILGVFYLYLFFLANNITGLPKIDGVEMKNVRRYWTHPILFVALWMHRLTMDLFVGIWIYRFGRYRDWNVRVELVLVWLGGPLGALVFAIRYWIASALVKVGQRKKKRRAR